MNKTIAVLIGSLRKESLTRKVAQALFEVASPSELNFQILEIGQLPLYNQDLDNHPPESWTEFRSRIKNSEGILFVTPEYNRSVPGVLKNAIDVASRPYGESAWEGKPAAIMSVSPGALGGFGANHHLRQSLVFLNMPCMPQPEGYLGKASDLFNSRGEIENPSIHEYLKSFMSSYADWVSHFPKFTLGKTKAA